MTRWLALAALALTACASETRYVEPTGQDDAWLREAASDAWSTVGVAAPTDYALLFLPATELRAACEDPSPGLVGCSVPTANVVLLNGESDPDLQAQTLIHEVGHLLKGARALDHGRLLHLDCPETLGNTVYGQSVMCPTNAAPGTLPTERDAAFVRR